jgi:hypothetical protein
MPDSFDQLRRMLLENYQQVVLPFAAPPHQDSTTVDADGPARTEATASPSPPPPAAAPAPPTEEEPAPAEPVSFQQSAREDVPPPPPEQPEAADAPHDVGSEAPRLHPSPLEFAETDQPRPSGALLQGRRALAVRLLSPLPAAGAGARACRGLRGRQPSVRRARWAARCP